MRDQRGTDLPGGSHLGSGISQPGAIWRQAGGTRSRETVVMEPFHGSHPAQSPFLRSQILCLTCSLQLAYDGSNLLECLLNRRYFGFRVTVKVQSTPHGASFCPNLVNKALKGQEKWVVRRKMFFHRCFSVLLGCVPGENCPPYLHLMMRLLFAGERAASVKVSGSGIFPPIQPLSCH